MTPDSRFDLKGVIGARRCSGPCRTYKWASDFARFPGRSASLRLDICRDCFAAWIKANAPRYTPSEYARKETP